MCRWLSDHKLTCEQAVGVLKVLLGLGDVQIQALVAIHPCLIDPENTADVLIEQGFQYKDEKQDARAAVGL
jgi:hypothetical protein